MTTFLSRAPSSASLLRRATRAQAQALALQACWRSLDARTAEARAFDAGALFACMATLRTHALGPAARAALAEIIGDVTALNADATMEDESHAPADHPCP